jgi:hypothetical protein
LGASTLTYREPTEPIWPQKEDLPGLLLLSLALAFFGVIIAGACGANIIEGGFGGLSISVLLVMFGHTYSVLFRD